MDPIERLNSLSEDVIQTFHSDFVFLIDAEKIQHFPARNWTHDQIIEELKKTVQSFTNGHNLART